MKASMRSRERAGDALSARAATGVLRGLETSVFIVHDDSFTDKRGCSRTFADVRGPRALRSTGTATAEAGKPRQRSITNSAK